MERILTFLLMGYEAATGTWMNRVHFSQPTLILTLQMIASSATVEQVHSVKDSAVRWPPRTMQAEVELELASFFELPHARSRSLPDPSPAYISVQPPAQAAAAERKTAMKSGPLRMALPPEPGHQHTACQGWFANLYL